MKDLKGKVAVITGAASGIGKALAFRCASEGMKIVISDVNEKALIRNQMKLKKTGTEVIYLVADVSKKEDIEKLARATLEQFNEVHLLFNNAGVQTLGSSIIDNTLNDWEWLIGVNLWGMIYSVMTFVPIMLKQDNECHIVNTSSIMGLLPGGGIYGVTKHGIVSLSESLKFDLEQRKSKIKISVLCPGFVRTFIGTEKQRPESLKNPSKDSDEGNADILKNMANFKKASLNAKIITPEEAADFIFNGIRENKFYILTPIGPIQESSILKRFKLIEDEIAFIRKF